MQMLAATTLSGKALSEYILASRAAILETSEENILFDIREFMRRQIIPGARLLGFALAWDVHWGCVGVGGFEYVDTEDDFARVPEATFLVNADGSLSGGAEDPAALREAIDGCLEDFIETLRG